MLKRTYAVAYTVRPNKKTDGVKSVLPLTVKGKIEQVENQAKILKTLCKLHRVNPDAIIIDGVTKIRTFFGPLDALQTALRNFIAGVRA